MLVEVVDVNCKTVKDVDGRQKEHSDNHPWQIYLSQLTELPMFLFVKEWPQLSGDNVGVVNRATNGFFLKAQTRFYHYMPGITLHE